MSTVASRQEAHPGSVGVFLFLVCRVSPCLPGCSSPVQIGVRLFGVSILGLGVNGCLSLYVGPAICCQPAQAVPHLFPSVSWWAFPILSKGCFRVRVWIKCRHLVVMVKVRVRP